MRISIGTRLFVAFVVTIVAILAATAAVIHWNFKRGFVDYVNDLRRGRVEVLVERLGEHYRQQNSWDFLRDNPRHLRMLMSRPGAAAKRGPAEKWRPDRMGDIGPRLAKPVNFARGIAVHDRDGELIVGPLRLQGERYDVISDHRLIGYVLSAPLKSLSADVDLRFARRQGSSLFWTLLAGLGLAALVAWFVARQLIRPIRTLADGTRSLTAGRYGTQVNVRQRDELGQLADDFNELSATLERSAQQRKELMADISHELRTPLAALRGQIAALSDGVRPLNVDTLGAVDAQISRLVGLVDELYELSLADAGALTYKKEALDLAALIQATLADAASRFAERDITLEQSWPDGELRVRGDRRRLGQLFANLFENCARYTDRGGQVRVHATTAEEKIVVTVEDSAPGVSDQDLPRLFERLYRVDKSRSRESGGAGLGLALVEKIAVAHGATVRAAHSPLGGVSIRIEFDMAGDGRDRL